MSAIDMKKVYRDYKGKWVALEAPGSNKVVASAKTLKEAMEKAEKKGYKMPAMMQVPKRLLPIVGAPQMVR